MSRILNAPNDDYENEFMVVLPREDGDYDWVSNHKDFSEAKEKALENGGVVARNKKIQGLKAKGQDDDVASEESEMEIDEIEIVDEIMPEDKEEDVVEKHVPEEFECDTEPISEETVNEENPVSEEPASEPEVVPGETIVDAEPAVSESDDKEEPVSEESADEEKSTEELQQDSEGENQSDNVEEPENTEDNTEKECLKRPPYHERYYLRYGNEEMPDSLDIKGTLELFRKLGYDNGFLKQARNAKSAIQLIEETYNPFDENKRFCDFCGAEIIGTEFERLADGRDRCPICSRTAIADEKEFLEIYEIVTTDLLRLFGVDVKTSITIEMVNAAKLHKKLGMKFVPTNNQDERVLGVAIKDKKERFTILLENGSPRVSSMATLIHEMTHIWQYLNWNAKEIKAKYGAKELEVYEGMAKWVEIQYLYLIGEVGHAKREEIYTRGRNDEYGNGFKKYIEQYPFSYGVQVDGLTPFGNKKEPLEL